MRLFLISILGLVSIAATAQGHEYRAYCVYGLAVDKFLNSPDDGDPNKPSIKYSFKASTPLVASKLCSLRGSCPHGRLVMSEDYTLVEGEGMGLNAGGGTYLVDPKPANLELACSRKTLATRPHEATLKAEKDYIPNVNASYVNMLSK